MSHIKKKDTVNININNILIIVRDNVMNTDRTVYVAG